MLSPTITARLSKICLSLGILLLLDASISQANPVEGNSPSQATQLLRQVLAQNDPEGVETETDMEGEDDMENSDTENSDTESNDSENNDSTPREDVIIDDNPTNMPEDSGEEEMENTDDSIPPENSDSEESTPPPSTTDDSEESTPPPATTDDTKQSRFGCEKIGSEYTVTYYPASQQGQSYPWAVPSQMGGGWSPEKRCNEIARRLELYRPDGLVELSNSKENGYDIICVTTEQDPSCRIVLTVPQGQDPLTTRDRVFQNIITADGGDSTTGVPTYQERNSNQTLNQIGKEIGVDLSTIGVGNSSKNSNAINLKPFLDRKDGGTGEKLDRVPQNRSRQLNPDNFR